MPSYELRFVIEADDEAEAQDVLTTLYGYIDQPIDESECNVLPDERNAER